VRRAAILILIGLASEANGQATEFEKTTHSIIYPTASGKIVAGQNSIYCASFKIVWHKMAGLTGIPVRLEKPSGTATELNLQDSTQLSVGDASMVSYAGVANTRDVEAVNQELKSKLSAAREYMWNPGTEGLMAFAYLKREIEFSLDLSETFEKEQRLVFNGDTVEFFGFRHGPGVPVKRHKYLEGNNPNIARRNILQKDIEKKWPLIEDFVSDDDFIFKIGSLDGNDEVWFAKVVPDSTLALTYRHVLERVKKNRFKYLRSMQLQLPYMHFSDEKRYPEIENRVLLNKGFGKSYFHHTLQIINFDLNDKGISLKSPGKLYEVAEKDPVPTKRLKFDKPFLIAVKERGKSVPYFLMWVGNSELMRKTKGK
jgi:hypothetical protein